MDGVEQAHSTRPVWKNTGNFIGPKLGTVAEITLQRTDTTHDLSSESREAIKRRCTKPNPLPHRHLPLPPAPSPTLLTTTSQTHHSPASPHPNPPSPTNPTPFSSLPNRFAALPLVVPPIPSLRTHYSPLSSAARTSTRALLSANPSLAVLGDLPFYPPPTLLQINLAAFLTSQWRT